MNHRIEFSHNGGADVLRWVECPAPAPGPGELLIRQRAIGLNFVDTYVRSGLYPVAALPACLGSEAAGTVQALGAGVEGFAVGDRVAYADGPPGAYAELRTLPARHALRLPDAIDFETAAALLLKGLTVQYLLQRTYRPQRDEIVLWYAAAGGVGLLACQWAQALGVRLIGVVGSDAKAAQARAAGAWATVVWPRENLPARVRELSQGAMVKVVYDSVGRDSFETSLDCLAPFGLLVSFGNASGPVTGVDLGILARKGSLYVTRPTLHTHVATRAGLEQGAAALFAQIASGALRVHIGQRWPLAEAAAAHRALEARQTTGASLLLP
ncbi:MAG: quinone oxidoreductase family protein [Metallibacterium sp.]